MSLSTISLRWFLWLFYNWGNTLTAAERGGLLVLRFVVRCLFLSCSSYFCSSLFLYCPEDLEVVAGTEIVECCEMSIFSSFGAMSLSERLRSRVSWSNEGPGTSRCAWRFDIELLLRIWSKLKIQNYWRSESNTSWMDSVLSSISYVRKY